tara:strand:- start:60504 stop:61316 length:813 start_codon:yes stop_codon:yes gene_type:complete
MKIIKPTVGGHDGSSFRELIDMWEEAGYCEVIPGPAGSGNYKNETLYPEARPWVNEIGDIMLYDNPILDKLHENLNWKMALWANAVLEEENSFSWTFWPKHPKKHAKIVHKGINSYYGRPGGSIFIGSYTTPKRLADWSKNIDFFWMGYANQRLFDHEKYLQTLSEFKFGLCLPGVGPKCLRDMELIGLGTVPIFTPGVSTQYYEKLEKDKHFLFAEKPEDAPRIVLECSKDKWEYMSNECIGWYERNASPKGSYYLTKRIIEENYDKKI